MLGDKKEKFQMMNVHGASKYLSIRAVKPKSGGGATPFRCLRGSNAVANGLPRSGLSLM
jgi:hypothetical protein